MPWRSLITNNVKQRILLLSIAIICFSWHAQAQIEDEYAEDELEDTTGIDTISTDELDAANYLEDFLYESGYYFDSSNIPAIDYYTTWDTKKIHPYEHKIDSIADSTIIILADTTDCLFHPPAVGKITSNFGIRRWRYRLKFHYGTDVKLYTGDPVYAAFDGVVRIAQYSRSYGYVVVMRHYNGLETIYAHFSKLLVVPGMSIRAGEPIGLGGSTGRSTGAHLHFEVRYKGIAFNPEKIIDFENNVLKHDTLIMDKNVFDHINEVKKLNAAKYHRVRRGETLGHIAIRYGTSVSRIKRLNGMRGTMIRAGQTIRVR